MQRKTRELERKNADLGSIISTLKDKRLISDQSLTVLESCAGGISDLVKRQIAKNSGKPEPA